MSFVDVRWLCALLSAAAVGAAQSRPLTIPEALAKAGSSLSSGPTVGSGLPPSLDTVLQETDLIVRGVVGLPVSYLSDDQTEVLTDYPLVAPNVLYQRDQRANGETSGVTVTILGGDIAIDGLTFSSRHASLPQLTPGSEGVFCLKRVGDQNHIALRYFGVFAVLGLDLVPLVRKSGFAPEVKGKAADVVIDELVRRARDLHTPIIK